MISVDEGYTQLTEYVNLKTKITMKCPNGHIFDILPHNWRRGVRCGICYRETLRTRQKTPVPQTPVTSINDVNKGKWLDFIKQAKTEYPNFTVTRLSGSDTTVKMRISRIDGTDAREIWVYKGPVIIRDVPGDVYPVTFAEGDVDIDIKELSLWMIDV